MPKEYATPPFLEGINHDIAAVVWLANTHERTIFYALDFEQSFQLAVIIFVDIKSQRLQPALVADGYKICKCYIQLNHQPVEFFLKVNVESH